MSLRGQVLAGLSLATACSGIPRQPEPGIASGVGYTQITLVDSARSLRPIQISLWYPSRDDGGSRPMTLAEYSRAITVEGTSVAVTPDVAAAGARELEGYLASLGATREGAHDALGMTLSAREDSPRPRSPLPTVVFGLGKDESAVMHADLAELVAASGFVVVTVPTVGTRSRATSWAVEDVSTHAADLDFALRTAARGGWSDTTRLAAIGYSYGSGAAVLFAQRHRGVRGLVLLDGSITFRDRLPTFREALSGVKVTAPVLYIGARNDARVDLSLLREIAPHAAVSISDSTGHLDFTTLAIVATRPGFEGFMRLGDELLPSGVAYRRVTRSVLAFIERHLR